MNLPGLERLLGVCQRLNLGLETSPPTREPLKVGTLLEGVSFDPVLASVYSRLGHAVFADRLSTLALYGDDEESRDFEKINKIGRDRWWEELGAPVIVFGGDVHAYATVPGLADEQGRQPVVQIDTYEPDFRVMPIASNVDRFFDSYSRYLEAADSHYQQTGERDLYFPWHATEILARDERLVELMRAGRFDALMKNVDDTTRRWATKVMGR
ncbi:hypothetical protein ACN28I_19430 [Archangium gephyra]|uniref:hypothetical protein n=1 Tax=Archangium gephyra TaxID=48 RepID=UPI003B771095